MKFNIKAEEEILKAIGELSPFGIECGGEGVSTVLKEGSELSVTYDGAVLTVVYEKRVQVFYALKRVADEGLSCGFFLRPAFRGLTYMLDCSRNAVPKQETLYELIRHLAVLGYNSLGLYMEDTFRVEGEPYFGYLRTPFTEEELRAADGYAKLFGIELVPYIQTLAHFNSLVRHYAMNYLFDVNDILLVGEEKTYAFLRKLIETCARTFTTRKINIGMDEAYMLGRGKYMDLNGAKGRFEIMSVHLERVNAICKEYGLQPAMWSDMFFSLALSEQYRNELPEEVINCVPENIELIYWDYCSTSEKHYAELIDKHLQFRNKIGFAAGAWKWLGYTPDNRYSYASCGAAARACIKKGIEDFIVTGWGDNGAECSVFATLPSLLYCSRINYGEEEIDASFKRSFLTLSGMPYDEFITVDLCNRVTKNEDVEEKNSANKYILFNDVLLGTLDTTLGEGINCIYSEHTKALKKAISSAGKWSYLFETQYRLSRVLEIKAELGILLRKAYQKGDKAALEKYYGELKKLPARIEEFYRAHAAQWAKENRANGFDVQDIRIGGLKQRVQVAIEKIGAYLKGETACVPELEEHLLDHMGAGDEYEVDPDQCEWRWRRMSSVNVNE